MGGLYQLLNGNHCSCDSKVNVSTLTKQPVGLEMTKEFLGTAQLQSGVKFGIFSPIKQSLYAKVWNALFEVFCQKEDPK